MDTGTNPPPFVDFGGRWVVVTGASSGIGRAVAVELARRGARLVLLGRDVDRLQATAGALGGGASEVVSLDLREPARLPSALEPVVARCGRFYGLCHCAGVVETVPLNGLKLDRLRSLFEVNVLAGLELARLVSRRDWLTENEGSLLFVASIYAAVGMPGQIGYSATKGALVSAARAMAMELARRRVRVNTISPGMVHTPLADEALRRLDPARVQQLESLHPLGPGTPEDVARAAVFLLAPENRWLTGVDFVLDGGYTAQ